MGRDGNFCCKTCKKNHYLGYGSYSSWLDGAKSTEEFDEQSEQLKRLWKNKNVRECLIEHNEHDFFTWSHDWASGRTGELILTETGYNDAEILVSDFGNYEQINMWEDDTI